MNDTASPYNGQTIPNLNGQGLFIRGGATSGVFQQEELQAHKRIDAGHSRSIHDTNYYGTPANVDYSPNEYGN